MKKSKRLMASLMAVSICVAGVNFPYAVNEVSMPVVAAADDEAVLKDYALQVWELVNAERAMQGIAPLEFNDDLNEVSVLRAGEITELFEHTRPDGTKCNTALAEFGLSTHNYGENIAYTSIGYPDQPEEVMDGWMNSEGHRKNILNEKYKNIGIGVAFADGVYYWVQTFTGDLNKSSVESAWNIDADGTLTISGAGYMEDYGFNGNYAPWYSERDNIKKVVVKSGIKSLGNYAFAGCDYITEVELPETVTKIGMGTFEGCHKLSNINLPSKLTGIGDYAFDFCESLSSVKLPDGLKTIGNNAFDNCTVLSEINIPDSVTSIGTSALSNCKMLTSVTIPDNVTNIGNGVFYGCEALESVTLPMEMTSIGENMFYQCRSLESINIPESITTIYDNAFGYCESLDSVTIPENVSSISAYAFKKCTSLKSVTVMNPDCVISSDIDTINDTAVIYGYSNSTAQAYAEKYNRNFVSLDDDSTFKWNITDGVLTISGKCDMPDYSDNNPAPWENDKDSITKVVINDGITNIGNYAFDSCENLTEVIIPDSVSVIGEYAFTGCIGLTSVNIPESVTNIGNSAFYNCGSFKEVLIMTILNPECQIYDYDYTLGENVAIYGYKRSTAQVYAKNYGKQFIAIDNANDTITWNLSDGVLTITGEGDMPDYDVRYTELNYSPWYGNQSIKEVIIGDGITSIGDCTFTRCENLTSVTIPDSVTEIGEYAFGICGLTEVSIPESVEIIGAMAFSNCINLKKINIPEKITTIDYNVFWECKELTEIKLPENLESIGNNAFSGCDGFSEVTVPASVKNIDSGAFSDCTGLESVTILNPDCEFYDYKDTIVSTATIYGYEGSTAQAYAEKYGNKFVAIGSGTDSTLLGDSNTDGNIDISDAVLIMQSLVNNDEYKLTEQGRKNADVVDGDGVTSKDALAIQMVIADIITADNLPITSADMENF